ncbi:MAG: hypothetical protein AAGJ82_06350, partial [Bacteroidota bacterium]
MRYLLVVLLLANGWLCAQDLENLEVRPPKISVSGNVMAGVRLFQSNQPNLFNNSNFGYLVSVRLNVKIGQFSLPFSYRLGDQLNLPDLPSFQYWGFSPRYRGLVLHLGHRSNRFTENTLNNIQQYGVGLEWTIKEKFVLRAARGILNRERFGRAIYNTTIQPLRERPFTAASMGYKKGFNELTLALLAANERPNATDSVSRKNRVAELVVGQTLLKKIRFRFRTAMSYTERDRTEIFPLFSEDDPWLQRAENIGLDPNLTTSSGFLLDSDLGYYGPLVNVSVGFRQVDDGFETFGRNFQLNDLRAYTVKTGLRLFQQRFILNGQVGIEQNNLQAVRVSQTDRLIAHANLVYRTKKGSGVQVNVSNFNLERVNRFIIGRDSFDFSYQSLTTSVSPFWELENSRLTGSFNYVRNENNVGEGPSSIVHFYYGQLSWIRQNSAQNFRLRVGTNGYYTVLNENKVTTLGVSLGVFYAWFEQKLQLNLRYHPNYRLSTT